MIQLDNFSVILQVRPDPPNVNFWEQLEQDFLHSGCPLDISKERKEKYEQIHTKTVIR